MIITIVGSNGGIGTRMAERLAAVAPDLKLQGIDIHDGSRVEVLEQYVSINLLTAIQDRETQTKIDQVLEQSDVLVMLAGAVHNKGLQEADATALNVDAPTLLFRRFRQLRSKDGVFVFSSSVSVYGDSDGHFNDESPCQPVSVYARSKLEAEASLLNAQAQSLSPDLHILRLATVVNRLDRGNLRKLVSAAMKTRSVPVVGNGILKSFIHVTDIAMIIERIIRLPRGASPVPLNVSAPPVDLSVVFNQIAEISSPNLRFPVPKRLIRWTVPTLGRSVEIDGTKIAEMLDIQYRPFTEAFREEFS